MGAPRSGSMTFKVAPGRSTTPARGAVTSTSWSGSVTSPARRSSGPSASPARTSSRSGSSPPARSTAPRSTNALAVLRRREPSLASRLRILESWGPHPIQPIVVSSRMPSALADRIAASLCSMHLDAHFARVLRSFGVLRFAPVADEEYAGERAALRSWQPGQQAAGLSTKPTPVCGDLSAARRVTECGAWAISRVRAPCWQPRRPPVPARSVKGGGLNRGAPHEGECIGSRNFLAARPRRSYRGPD